MRFLLRFFHKLRGTKPTDFPMVSYWKTKSSVQAKVTKGKDGSVIMLMEGEKYPFPTFPRGYLLFGQLSKLKHEIKNRVFNDSWWKLEKGVPREQVIQDIKRSLFGEITELAETMKYEMVPAESMCPSIREIHRAMTVAIRDFPEREQLEKFRDYLCFVLQEDDGYRNRIQWVVKFFNPRGIIGRFLNPAKMLERALILLEHAEVIQDMKDRVRLLRRISMLVLEDPMFYKLFLRMNKECDWRKVALSESDKYHFRGKYFKVDYDILEY